MEKTAPEGLKQYENKDGEKKGKRTCVHGEANEEITNHW